MFCSICIIAGKSFVVWSNVTAHTRSTYLTLP